MSVTLSSAVSPWASSIDTRSDEWWRSSVIYQIYPRSFKDSNGDGIGDLPGITSELHKIADLGVDAVWLSPFYVSPQKDAGYDVADYCAVDPMFGTLNDFDALLSRAHQLRIKVIIDIVPNHASTMHALFIEALNSVAGSDARNLFVFRDGKGESGELPPNNWQSHFGGSAWTRVTETDGELGQWYLHLFDSSQPDWNWGNPTVHAEFERVLRFWLDRGVDGFRVDVAHALVKHPDLPDWGGAANGKSVPGFPGSTAPMFGQAKVHDIFRSWRTLLDSYDGERVLCAEANVDPVERIADWVRSDEMHQAFNFAFLGCGWDAAAMKSVVTNSLASFDAVGAPTTWVLSNHDKVRHTTRYGMEHSTGRGKDGIGVNDPQPNTALGLNRARAASLFMLGLPGGAYLYQGEELGLPDNTTMDDSARQDPTYARTSGALLGRDGCRVPLPWTVDGGSCGFSDSGVTWLPVSEDWGSYAREVQEHDPDSTLALYRTALSMRKELMLGSGSLEWVEESEADVLAFRNGEVRVLMNMGSEPVTITNPGSLIAASSPFDGVTLLPNQTVWMHP